MDAVTDLPESTRANILPEAGTRGVRPARGQRRQQEDGTMAVIAPGTGLGEAFVIWDGSRYRSHPLEGGHDDFAPTTPMQIGLIPTWR